MALAEGFGRDCSREEEKVHDDITLFFCFVRLLND
jgi:hypothetical protein